MLLIPKGIKGQWLDCVYWTLAAEMAFYGLVFCTLLTKKVTLRHLAWGLTIYSAVFNAFSMLVLSGALQSDMLYWVVLMFRVPGATWLLNHGCFFALGIWLFISANRTLTALERVAVVVTCLSGCAEIYYFFPFPFERHTRHLGSIGLFADPRLGCGGVAHCLRRAQKPARCRHRFS